MHQSVHIPSHIFLTHTFTKNSPNPNFMFILKTLNLVTKMSGQLGDKKNDTLKDDDLNDRIDDKLSDGYSEEEEKYRTPDSKFRSKEGRDYDEEDDGEYLSDEYDKTGRSRADPTEEEERPSGTLRSNEQEHLIRPTDTQNAEKFVAYQFKPITADADPKDFELKTHTRFSLGARMFKACCCCFSNKRSIELMKQDKPYQLFSNEEFKGNKIEIKINKSGPLELDQFILHPFVKVHIVDLNTYKYLAKSDPLVPGVYNNETAAYYNAFKTHFEYPKVDYYLPLATRHYDLRPKAENYCSWYENFVIDCKVEDFLRPNVVILFEILDYSPALILDNSKQLNADNMLPVCWGFLRPIGQARQHLADSKIQLYRYKGRHSKQRRLKNEIDLRTPDVLCELNWPNKSKYPSYLEVNVSFYKPEEKKVISHFSRFPWEQEVGLREFRRRDIKRRAIKFQKQKAQEVEPEERIKFFKWERTRNEACKRPDKFLRKLDTEELGAFRIKFSNNGEYLAAACTFNNSRTIIKIFKVTTGELLMKLKGHHDIIHEFSWSRYDNILISASADGCVKVWNVSDKDADIPDKLNHNENDKLFFICELVHPSYVYAAKFFKEEDDITTPYKIIATACYDQSIRFWIFVINEKGEYLYNNCIRTIYMMNLDNVKKALVENKLDMDFLQNPTITTYVYPNCLTFDRSGKMYVGDSIGLIRTWDVSYIHDELYTDNYFIIKHKEIEDDIINKIMIDPNDEDKLIVQSRDSCIRIIEFDRALKKDVKVRIRLFGARSQYQMILSCVSPDGTYLASGSENGNIYVWSIPTEELFSQDYNCKFLDSTCDVDWNNKYNMIATCGFGESYPILMYVYEKSQKEIDFSLGRNLLDEEYHDDKVTLGSTPQKDRSFDGKSDYSRSRKSSFKSQGRSDRKTDIDKDSVYSDGNSVSRIGKQDNEYNIYNTPERR